MGPQPPDSAAASTSQPESVPASQPPSLSPAPPATTGAPTGSAASPARAAGAAPAGPTPACPEDLAVLAGTGPAAAPAAVGVRDLVVVRGDVRALDGVTVSLAPGQVTLLRGGNGSGKSTLLLTLAGCLQAASGEVRGAGLGRTALVPQSPPSAQRLPVTVRTVVEMARWSRTGLLGRLRREDRLAVAQAMEAVGVSGLAGRQLSRISGGQLQRALVAQALASGAEVLLLDEPTASADVGSARVIHEVARERARQGATVVLASHDPTARDYADVVLELSQGRLLGGPASPRAGRARLDGDRRP